jgi:hypothetical protein
MRLIRIIRDFNPEVVHLQDTNDWRLSALFTAFRRRTTVLTLHDVARHLGEAAGLQRIIGMWNRRVSKKVIVHGRFL